MMQRWHTHKYHLDIVTRMSMSRKNEGQPNVIVVRLLNKGKLAYSSNLFLALHFTIFTLPRAITKARLSHYHMFCLKYHAHVLLSVGCWLFRFMPSIKTLACNWSSIDNAYHVWYDNVLPLLQVFPLAWHLLLTLQLEPLLIDQTKPFHDWYHSGLKVMLLTVLWGKSNCQVVHLHLNQGLDHFGPSGFLFPHPYSKHITPALFSLQAVLFNTHEGGHFKPQIDTKGNPVSHLLQFIH